MKEDLEDWIRAGEIAARIRRRIVSSNLVGKSVLKLAEDIEKQIIRMGAKPAFPVNISINEVAAHYTPPPQDETLIPAGSIVKIDFGANVNGALSDTAVTVIAGSVSKNIKELVKATECALMEAIDILKDGVRISQVSSKIWEIAHQRGFGVITDLGGHALQRWRLHAGIFIPNIPKKAERRKLKEGMIVAIEPFLVSSEKDSETKYILQQTYIFSVKGRIRNSKLIELLWQKYRTLPFALRWLTPRRDTGDKLVRVLYTYAAKDIVIPYPVLVDARNNWVAQFEHTVLIRATSAEILTG